MSHSYNHKRSREMYIRQAYQDRRHWTEDTLTEIQHDMETVCMDILEQEKVYEEEEVDAHKRLTEQNAKDQSRDQSGWIKRAVLYYLHHPPKDVHHTYQTPMVDTIERYEIDWKTPRSNLKRLFNSITAVADTYVYQERVEYIISNLERLQRQIEHIKPLSAKQIEYSDRILALTNDWYAFLGAL